MPRKKAEKLNRSHGGTNKQCFNKLFCLVFVILSGNFIKVVLKLHTSSMFLKRDTESPLVHKLVFDDKNKQLISNDKHVFCLNFCPIMTIGGTVEIKD